MTDKKKPSFLDKAIVCGGKQTEEEFWDSLVHLDDLPPPTTALDDADLGPEDFEQPKPEEFTCFECGASKTCEWAWDLYNTNGDCLAEK